MRSVVLVLHVPSGNECRSFAALLLVLRLRLRAERAHGTIVAGGGITSALVRQRIWSRLVLSCCAGQSFFLRQEFDTRARWNRVLWKCVSVARC